MTPLAQALNTALLHFIWQGIAIGLLLWIALYVLRSRSAHARYVACCGALALLALAPVVTGWTAYVPRAEALVSVETISSAAEVQGPGASVNPPARILSGFGSLEAWILPAWALGVALFALRLMWCWRHTSALRRTGTLADSTFLAMVSRAAERIGVTRSIHVLMSSVADVPSVIGWARPVLLLPVAVATGLTPEQLEAVIAHELAHIRRHDYLVNLGQTVVETVLFYHPVVWWVSSKIRYERELCCDDLAVAAVGDAASYARALARLEQVRMFRPSLAMGAARGPLFHRIERLLGGDGLQQGPSRLACAIGLLVGVACLALNMGWAQSRQGPQSDTGTIRVEDFFPPLPPVPPMPPIPAMPRIPPIPPMPPMPQSLSPALFAAYESFIQRVDVPWVLFRGDRVMSNGSSADETEARVARQSAGGGDTLWFRLEGKAYITQDKAILDRVIEPETSYKAAIGLVQALLEQKQRLLRENEARRSGLLEDLQANLASLKSQMPTINNSLENLSSFRREVETVRQRLAELEDRLHQQELEQFRAKIDAQREAEVIEGAGRSAPQIPYLLRDAVSSGKARPVQ